jgi:tetratricopeptide (TPR) repeat protein
LSSRAYCVGKATVEVFNREKSEEGARKYPQVAEHYIAPTSPVLTSDDKLPFVFTVEQGKEAFEQGVKDALKQWEVAITKANTAEEKAESYYLRGWCKKMLHNPLYTNYVSSGLLFKLHPLLETTQIVADFRKATELMPERADYWRSLGDACTGDEEVAYDMTAEQRDEAIRAYEKSLALQRTDYALWFRLHNLCAETNPGKALHYINQAIRYDSNNMAWYLTKALFESEKKLVGSKEDGHAPVETLEQAAQCSRYQYVFYSYDVPRTLAKMWGRPTSRFTYNIKEIGNYNAAFDQISSQLQKASSTKQLIQTRNGLVRL